MEAKPGSRTGYPSFTNCANGNVVRCYDVWFYGLVVETLDFGELKAPVQTPNVLLYLWIVFMHSIIPL